jgi:hypothetical protein
MKELPILFNGEMVRAIMEGRKTQTRRPVKPQPNDEDGCLYLEGTYFDWEAFNAGNSQMLCPFGQPGDRLWVRETFLQPLDSCQMPSGEHETSWGGSAKDILYCADGAEPHFRNPERCYPTWLGKRPSIHMPRWASRITLEVIGVRVERVDNMSPSDAHAEGIKPLQGGALAEFRQLWDSIYSKQGLGWKANPWVWVVEFKVIP